MPGHSEKRQAYPDLKDPLVPVVEGWNQYCLDEAHLQPALEAGLAGMHLNAAETFSDMTPAARLNLFSRRFPILQELLEDPNIIYAPNRVRNVKGGTNFAVPVDSYEAKDSRGVQLLMATFIAIRKLTEEYSAASEKKFAEIVESAPAAFAATDRKEPKGIMHDNMQTGADAVMITTYGRNADPEEVLSILQALHDPDTSGVPPIRRMGATAFNMWFNMRELGIFPQPLTPGTTTTSPEFIAFLRTAWKHPEAFHGGCPATGYLEKFLEVYVEVYKRLMQMSG